MFIVRTKRPNDGERLFIVYTAHYMKYFIVVVMTMARWSSKPLTRKSKVCFVFFLVSWKRLEITAKKRQN